MSNHSFTRGTLIAEIGDLVADKIRAEAKLFECEKSLAETEAELRSLREVGIRSDYSKACSMSVEAWRASIKGWEADITRYDSQIACLLRDNLSLLESEYSMERVTKPN